MIDDYNDSNFIRELFTLQSVGSSLTNSFDLPYEIAMYHRIQREIKADPHTHWGKGLRALVISDRCGGRALGLCEYLIKLTDLEVQMLGTAKSIREAVQTRVPDIVIFVGYQESKENYDILTAQQGQRPELVIMYASVDNIIQSECARYRIPLMYHCLEPMAGFVRVLRDNLPVS